MGLGSHTAATGVADGELATALLCADGLAPEQLQAVFLHEVAHLFDLHVTRAVMPSWFREGFAEQYGGDGTFVWDGTSLEVGGLLDLAELDPIRSPSGFLPLPALLSSDALGLLATDAGSARRFYAEAWAFVRFLEEAASPTVQDAYRLWLAQCRGKSIGAKPGQRRTSDAHLAAAAFQQILAEELAALETAFQDYLAAL